jgi:hypothetical protein
MSLMADFPAIHVRLAELFASHQDLLLEQRVPEARMVLDAYRELLDLHMDHEEECLLPAYERVGPMPLWPVRLYTGQHRRMRDLLRGAAERLSLISGRGPATRSAIIAVLDHEATFKRLVEHHEDAEHKGLFVALAFELPLEEQMKLVDPCLLEWHHAATRILPPAPLRNCLEDCPH